jgi:hypothetical protein
MHLTARSYTRIVGANDRIESDDARVRYHRFGGLMSDQEPRIGKEELQFDRVITESPSPAAPGQPGVTCAACRTSIQTVYHHINGKVFCSRCRSAVESAARTPRGLVPLMTAGLFGLGAGAVGAAIYYAVIAFAHLEIGLVAILIGYMVGYAVRKGARGSGGLRFQVMAVALTYAAIALAYTPIAVNRAFADPGARNLSSSTTGSMSQAAAAPERRRVATANPGGIRVLLSFAFLLAFVAALPVLVVVSSLPFGLISAFIIFIGMRQAWRMTGAPRLEILGPYRVGAAPVSTPA